MTGQAQGTALRRLGTLSFLAGLLAWLVSSSWSPFVARPSTFLVAAAVGVALVAATGLALRLADVATLAVVVMQVAVGFGWLQWRFDDLGPLWRSVRRGAEATNTYEAPVPAEFLATAPFLATAAVALAIGLDLLVVGWLRTAIVGLPLLLALTIPISTLDERIPLPLLLAVLGVFSMLLALEHRWASDDWGQPTGSRPVLPQATLVAGLAAGAALLGLGTAAVLPTGEGIDLNGGAGQGRGQLDVSNPMVEVRRGLVNQSHLEMLMVSTPRRTPRYLRLAALDHFEDGRWTPSARELPRENRVGNGIPEAPGLYSSVPGNAETHEIRYSEAFSSQWLATPYPYLSVDISGGDYRYDERTLDVFNVDRNDSTTPTRDGYSVEAFFPAFDAEDLDTAGSAPQGVAESMTALPDDMPGEIERITARVVGEERTDYQRVVALQDWFRESGGFRYSLWDGPSTGGLEGLVGFLTTDKVGYCEQFATAMAVMTRTIGIPSRVAVGFGRPQSSPSDGTYLFTGESLHAWTEVYFEGYGWVVFDPTPAVQSGPAPAYSEGIREDPRVDTGPTATPSAQPAPTRPDRAPDAGTDPTDDQGTPLWPVVVLGIALALATVPRIVRLRRHRERLGVLRDDGSDPVALADAAWQELRATALDHRLTWTEARSPRVTLAGLHRQLDLDRAQAGRLGVLSETFERARYARTPQLTTQQRRDLLDDTTMLLGEIRAAVTPAARRRARWWPASLWT